MQFFVVLPNEEDADPASLAADIADYILKPAVTLQTQSEEGGSLNVHVRFPEFESKYTTFFEGTKIPGLVASPISPAIYDGDLMTQISQVAKIKVDKEGTTAAAVTEITLTGSSMPPAPPEEVNIICDRPFVYFIYDPVNQDIAFLGYVRNL
jgi:serine protease inhibitor